MQQEENIEHAQGQTARISFFMQVRELKLQPETPRASRNQNSQGRLSLSDWCHMTLNRSRTTSLHTLIGHAHTQCHCHAMTTITCYDVFLFPHFCLTNCFCSNFLGLFLLVFHLLCSFCFLSKFYPQNSNFKNRLGFYSFLLKWFIQFLKLISA